MAASLHQGTSVRTNRRGVPAGAGLLLGCMLAAPALAQDAARPQPGAIAAVEAAATPATATPAPRKRGAFGEAMSRLTQALREASEQPASTTPATTASPAPPATTAQPAAARVEPGALAVESPP